MASSNKPKLPDRVRHVIRRKGYSIRTEKDCVSWIRRFILFRNKRHPKSIGASQIEAFIIHHHLHESVIRRAVRSPLDV